MKKKVLVLITALVMVFACVLGLVACGDDFEEGTYVMYSVQGKDVYAMGEYELKDGKITGTGVSGTYKVDGDTVTVKIKDVPDTKVTKKENYWITSDKTMLVCKKGKTPKGYTVKEMPAM
ncbi:MAG: hypothetical protein J1F69_02090 [Clostridiales bacterium]|nr:hypothetical protein [Clostridiales bacterium]